MGSFEFTRMDDDSQGEDYEEEQGRLDNAFNSNIADMKPFVISLPVKEERQRLARWIKKLCGFPGPKLKDRKNRNLYAKMLLVMLRKGLIDEPFLKNPPSGKLPIIPAYMSVRLEESLTNQIFLKESELYPGAEWIRDELASSGETFILPRRPKGSPSDQLFGTDKMKPRRKKKVLEQHDLRPKESIKHSSRPRYEEKATSRPSRRDMSSSESDASLNDYVERNTRKSATQSSPRAPKASVFGQRSSKKDPILPLDDPYGLGSFQNGQASDMGRTEKPRLRFSNYEEAPKDEKKSVKRMEHELDLQNKILEAKFEEERLVQQQKHDMAVRKILERKKVELEDVKSYFKRKITTMEELNQKYEQQVALMSQDLNVIKERSSREIDDLKETIKQNIVLARHEKDKEVHDTIAAFEQEKFDLQKHHARLAQELKKETEERVKRMDAEHSKTVSNLKNKILNFETERDKLRDDLKALERKFNTQKEEKEDLQRKVEQFTQEMGKSNSLNEKYEKEIRTMINDHDNLVRSLRKKTDKAIEDMKREHTLSSNQAAEMIGDLEKKISEYKQVLQEAEYQSKKELRELETNHKQEMLRIEVLYDKKVRNMQREKEECELEMQSKVQRLENQLSDKEDKVNQLQEQVGEQARGAEAAINDFKLRAEEQARKVYQEMADHADRIEKELNDVKEEKQLAVEKLQGELEKEKTGREQEIAEMRATFDGEKNLLHRSYQTERESILQEHQRDREMLVFKYEEKLKELEKKMEELKKEKSKMTTQLENQVRELREEVIRANNTRKQQLVELGMLREEEKQNAKRQEASAASRFKTQLDEQRLQLQKAHKGEIDHLLERTNTKLKDIEKEYEEKSQADQSTITELQRRIIELEETAMQTKTSNEAKISELSSRFYKEREELLGKQKSTSKSLQQDMELYRIKGQQLERKCQQLELENQERISSLRLHYEDKMRGLLPAAVQRELESTIASLKEQISVLQARVVILQGESDASMLSKTRSPHPLR